MHKLERIIRDQLFDEISQSTFDIGYIQGSHTVTVRGKEDLLEVWSSLKKGGNIILWCDGLKRLTKKGAMSNDSSEDDDEEVVKRQLRRKGRGQKR